MSLARRLHGALFGVCAMLTRRFFRRFVATNKAAVDSIAAAVARSWPYTTVEKTCFSFSNGVYDLVADRFITDPDPNCRLVAINHFDFPCPPAEGKWVATNPEGATFLEMRCEYRDPNPPRALDRIMEHQGFDSETTLLLCACLGRLFRPISDSLKCMMYLVGESDTGKSVILVDFIQSVFMPMNRCILASGTSTASRFALAPAIGKDIVICPEAKDLMLDEDQLCNKIEGGDMHVPVKNAPEYIGPMRASMAFGGNDKFLRVPNASGQISSRVLYFPFREKVSVRDQDTSLKDRVRGPELGPAIIKCWRCYLFVLNLLGSRRIKALADTRSMVYQESWKE